jgi:hypothetical protein
LMSNFPLKDVGLNLSIDIILVIMTAQEKSY